MGRCLFCQNVHIYQNYCKEKPAVYVIIDKKRMREKPCGKLGKKREVKEKRDNLSKEAERSIPGDYRARASERHSLLADVKSSSPLPSLSHCATVEERGSGGRAGRQAKRCDHRDGRELL
ncbi:hypothetical protein PoB_001417700 [Plakobranchus ocellatus]|uniref:Uncharacterized protein n=1 Tax=Plakobranchus ocellatus TaxID=259542 RepID=A0AAV3YZB7_9GAST|nr:hypothetical protein PoB_001417700 [Plakobranchus ocellatus]